MAIRTEGTIGKGLVRGQTGKKIINAEVDKRKESTDEKNKTKGWVTTLRVVYCSFILTLYKTPSTELKVSISQLIDGLDYFQATSWYHTCLCVMLLSAMHMESFAVIIYDTPKTSDRIS